MTIRRLFVAVATLASLVITGLSHGDDSHFFGVQDVQVKVTKITGNIYMLQGRGGNIAAITGPQGILIVDDDYKVMSEKLRDALKGLGSPIPRFILNTHWHGDHTEGNLLFGSESMIVAHANVRKRLLAPPILFGEKTDPYPAFALPMVTYTQRMSLYFDGEQIELVHYPRGHTDGDTVVIFKNAKVAHLGDHFFVKRFPFVDLDSGGSVNGLVHNLQGIIQSLPEDAQVIPGHGPLTTVAELKDYYRMIVETSQLVEEAMKAGKTLEDIKKAGLQEKYKEAGTGFIKTDQWIETIYKSASKR